jgi:four helix bundle protein
MHPPPPWDIRERAFEFACEIVRFCQKLAQKRSCWSIADQLLRAGTGVAANAAEAKGAYSRKEFAVKNNHALKEARESQLWLRIIVCCQLSDDEAHAKRLLQEAGELTGIFTATVRSTRRGL